MTDKLYNALCQMLDAGSWHDDGSFVIDESKSEAVEAALQVVREYHQSQKTAV